MAEQQNMARDEAPDWPPQRSAIGLPEGHRQHSSVGQLWEVKGGQWQRIRLEEPHG